MTWLSYIIPNTPAVLTPASLGFRTGGARAFKWELGAITTWVLERYYLESHQSSTSFVGKPSL